jgi:hypothetical protein
MQRLIGGTGCHIAEMTGAVMPALGHTAALYALESAGATQVQQGFRNKNGIVFPGKLSVSTEHETQ